MPTRQPEVPAVMRIALSLLVIAALAESTKEGPCDIFAAGGTPCVAAHSTTRALYRSYNSSLYQVMRSSDRTTRDIPTLSVGGVANSAVQSLFCAGTRCFIQRIYDQSPNQNHLSPAPGGGAFPLPDRRCNAMKEKLKVGGHTVFSAYFEGIMGYRNDNTSGVATGDEAETIYMVTSGTHYNSHCCFDYGNAEIDNHDDGKGTMEAVDFGNAKGRLNHGGAGHGPWIMADLEDGLWGANVVESNETSINYQFVTAMIKGDSGAGSGHWAIKGGNAQAGGLKVYWDGERPNATGYAPMKKQGALILGIGGDNSPLGVGTFYEGCVTKGFSTDATDDALQANIVAAGYGK